MSTPKGALEVILFNGPKLIGSLMFTSAEITVGRHPEAMVRLDDPAVSLQHALIHFTGRSALLEDMGSRTGFRVNGTATTSQLIGASDEVSIGKFRLRLVVHQSEPARLNPEEATHVAGLPHMHARTEDEVTRVDDGNHLAPPLDNELTNVVPPRSKGATAQIGSPVAPRGDASDTAPTAAAPPAPLKAPFAAPAPARPVLRPDPAPTRRATAAREASHGEDLETRAELGLGRHRPETERPSERTDRPTFAPPKSAVAPGEAGGDHDDDDDDEDANFVPSFSLFEELRLRGLGDGSLLRKSPAVGVELIRHTEGEVVEIRHLALGEKYRLPGRRKVLCRRSEPRQVTLFDAGKVHLFEGERELSREELGRRSGKSGTVRLEPGLVAEIALSSRERLFIQYVPETPPIPPSPLSFKPSREGLTTAGGAFAVHILSFLLIGITANSKVEEVDLNEGRYAKIAIKELELEPPPPPPPAPEPVKPEPEPPPPPPEPVPPTAPLKKAPQQKAVVKHSKMPPVKVAQAPGPVAPGPPGPPKPSAASTKLLSALGSALPNNSSSPSSATAVSNLDAVTSTRSGSGFKVSGAIGKIPGDQLRLAAGGSGTGRIDTKTAAELTRGNQLGTIKGAGGGSGKVRALVTAPPSRTVQVQGELDRGEITKVINAHMREVQGCYERQLINEPTLFGKIVFDWVITPSGSVGVVRVKFSDLRSSAVSSCIQSAIQSWHFPQPRGGSVSVIYPFVFKTMAL